MSFTRISNETRASGPTRRAARDYLSMRVASRSAPTCPRRATNIRRLGRIEVPKPIVRDRFAGQQDQAGLAVCDLEVAVLVELAAGLADRRGSRASDDFGLDDDGRVRQPQVDGGVTSRLVELSGELVRAVVDERSRACASGLGVRRGSARCRWRPPWAGRRRGTGRKREQRQWPGRPRRLVLLPPPGAGLGRRILQGARGEREALPVQR